MKNCKSCGAELENSASFCPKCGSIVTDEPKAVEVTLEQPVAEASSAAETATYYEEVKPAAEQVSLELPVEDSDSTKKLKKLLFIAAGAIAVVLVIALLYNTFIGNAFKKPIDKYLAAVNKQSTDVQELLGYAFPEMIVNVYENMLDYKKAYDDATGEETYDIYMENMEERLLDIYDEIEDDFGKNTKVTYKIIEKEEISKSQIRSYKDTFELIEEMLTDEVVDSAIERIENNLVNNFDLKNKEANDVAEKMEKVYKDLLKDIKDIEVTAGYELTVEYKIEGKDDEDEDEITLIVLKVNGKWCCTNLNAIDEIEDIYNTLSSILSSVY